MDLEQDIRSLLSEEIYLSGLIKELKELIERKEYANCTDDATRLLNKLKGERVGVKRELKRLEDEAVSTAEACRLAYENMEGLD